jgi:hypothetical protein
MEEYFDVENNWFEENEELLVESSLFNEDWIVVEGCRSKKELWYKQLHRSHIGR